MEYTPHLAMVLATCMKLPFEREYQVLHVR